MLVRQASKSRGVSSGRVTKFVEPPKSPSSSATSSSKHNLETSAEGLCSSASSSARSKPGHFTDGNLESFKSKENITVTVRFRPLSQREIHHGEELGWYADGETIVRNEFNPSIAYAFDRVFSPTTTTRHVYDVAAQYVISGAMEGVNGTIFAYGMTSSGKTHTMHGDQRSPGIIPLAVKDAFSIIQETPNREFLLRVSYLEIYNEVVNDLLNPTGQNLRIREDSQGTFIDGLKEEVVLSPAHALSLVAAGEEHRHVGCTNISILSSRSHTIFTLIIESSPCDQHTEGEAVTFSKLNLIDLAGSECSDTETTGSRRREVSYINKSLLTLGTVISKLAEGTSTHIPYRDSKLTRILESSLCGRDRISLICTITPASSSSEETYKTLKFAHRAKHIEISASQNKIIDEKSLIKKYQNEIRHFKEELEMLEKGIISAHQLKDIEEGDNVCFNHKIEENHHQLQSRWEQEEAKAVLHIRIQKLTRLILISTKANHPSHPTKQHGPRRRNSFAEEELSYLPSKRRDLVLDEQTVKLNSSSDGNVETPDEPRGEKKIRKHGFLNWLKLRKRESRNIETTAGDKTSGLESTSAVSSPSEDVNFHAESKRSPPLHPEISFKDNLQDASLVIPLGEESPPISRRTSEEIESLRAQQKVLSSEIALHSTALKRLVEEASRNPHEEQVMGEMMKINEDIKEKSEQISSLELQINSIMQSQATLSEPEMSQKIADLTAQLHENSFELEVKAADNRVIQDQLNQKVRECETLQETLAFLQHLSRNLHAELAITEKQDDLTLQSQSVELQELKERVAILEECKELLEIRNRKLADESTYAKGLASAAAVELKALSEEVAKLLAHNGRLAGELDSARSSAATRGSPVAARSTRRELHGKPACDVRRELAVRRERELHYEAALTVKDQNEVELLRRVEESKQREAYLENELANMWVLVAKLKKSAANQL